MRRFWWGFGAAALAAAGGLGPVQVSVSAQAAPTLEVSPLRLNPGAPVTFAVVGCPVLPVVTVTETDMVFVVEMTAGPGAGEWRGDLAAGQVDWFVGGECGDQAFEDVRVDIDNPLIGFQPIGSMVAPEGFPSTVYGSDCPDGTAAQVRFDDFDFGQPAAVSTTLVTAPIDDRGDWQVDVPGYLAYGIGVDAPLPPGTVLRERTVSASCGDVTYEVLRIPIQVVGEEDAPPVVAERPPPPASPAAPLSGGPDYTG